MALAPQNQLGETTQERGRAHPGAGAGGPRAWVLHPRGRPGRGSGLGSARSGLGDFSPAWQRRFALRGEGHSGPGQALRAPFMDFGQGRLQGRHPGPNSGRRTPAGAASPPRAGAQHRPAPPLGGAGSGSPGQRCRTHRSAVGAHSSAGPELRGQGRAARPVLPASAGPGTTATALPPASSGRRALRWRPRRRGSAQPPGGSAPRRASRGNGRSKTASEKKRGPASSRERGPPKPPKSLSRGEGGAAFLPIT